MAKIKTESMSNAIKTQKLDHSYNADGNVKGYNYSGK